MITKAIDETNRIALEGNTRPEANLKNDRGIVSEEFPMEHMQLLLRRPAEQEAALRKFIDELHDPNSPNYHQWMTAEQFGAKWGVAKEDIASVTRWLEGYGFKVNVVYTNGMEIDFSGTAGQVRRAFQTEVHQLNVKGKNYFANMSNPKIPAALSEAVEGVVSMHNFKPQTMYKSKKQYTITSANAEAVVPADLATIYNLNPLFTAGTTGKGQTVVVVEDTNMKAADWTAFRNKFGLQVSKFPGAKLTQVHPASTGTNNCLNPGLNGDEGEAALDVEWASTSAPAAAIELISCADTTTFGGLLAIQNLLNAKATPPAILSMSYGECEAFSGAALNAAFNTAFQQAVTEGVSVFVSSGDQAASTCDRDAVAATHGIGITGWGETIYNVAVGGTDFSDNFSGTASTYWKSTNTSTFGSALSYIPEMPWNDSCASTVIAEFVTGSTVTYGLNGFCNTGTGEEFLDTVAGGGGPSKCATGSPAVAGVVGGTCKGYAKPSWQTGVIGIQKDAVRDIPDVSLFAANGVWGHYFVFCFSDATEGGTPCTGAPSNWAGFGGTSVAAPVMAGVQALVNQNESSAQGNPNYVYYALAASTPAVFHTVTQGDIDVNCGGIYNCFGYLGTVSYGRGGRVFGTTWGGALSVSNTSFTPAYGTGQSWNFATGIGSVDVFNLVTNWSKNP